MNYFFINKHNSTLRAVLMVEEETRARNMRIISRESLNFSPIPRLTRPISRRRKLSSSKLNIPSSLPPCGSGRPSPIRKSACIIQQRKSRSQIPAQTAPYKPKKKKRKKKSERPTNPVPISYWDEFERCETIK